MNLMADRRPSTLPDAWEKAHAWLTEHGQAAMVTVVSTWGSAPVPAGGQLVATSGERFEGSVSGGCVEVDVLVEAAEAMASGRAKLIDFGIDEETAWRAGLPCGGKLTVLVDPLRPEDASWLEAIIAARKARKSVVATTNVDTGGHGLLDPRQAQPAGVEALADAGAIGLAETPDGTLLVHPLVPPLRVVVAGATHVGQVFAALAREVGYQVAVVDPRPLFVTEERFGEAAAMAAWPEASFDRLGLDARTAVVALTHASHIDDEALSTALRSPCVYIGALGSRATHAKRLERLRAAGFDDVDLARIHAPVGLAIGAKGPAEIAVSILAELIKVVRGAR